MIQTRRNFLRRGSLLATGSIAFPGWMPRMVFRDEKQEPNGDVLIVVFARGGYDGLNMVIPYLDEGYYFGRRPTVAIPTAEATMLDTRFGMHPTLASPDAGRWKEWYDDGVLGIVHAVHMDDPTRSHFDAQDFMERGTPGAKSVKSGWLGRHLETMRHQNESPFRAVGWGSMLQSSLRSAVVPAVTLQSIADFHLQGDQSQIQRFQQRLQELYSGEGWLDVEGQQTFAAVDLLERSVGNPDGYVPANGANYLPNDGFHQGLKQLAMLIKADVGLEVACIDTGGWDTHANQVLPGDPAGGNMANRMRQLSTGITAFIDDLRDRFDPNDTTNQGVTVVVMSEFGRRAYENGGYGTDHGHGNAMFFFGRGINGGRIHGDWPGLADENLDRGDLAGETEYRDLLGEILAQRLGNQAVSQVFPGHPLNYLGIARPINAPAPTETPEPEPEPTETPEDKEHEIYIPWTTTGE